MGAQTISSRRQNVPFRTIEVSGWHWALDRSILCNQPFARLVVAFLYVQQSDVITHKSGVWYDIEGRNKVDLEETHLRDSERRKLDIEGRYKKRPAKA